ncbi:hypothetical protein HI814_14190 [Ralstonia solanacearum]|jgi:hypothetical protein|nr:hypothetical protein HI814_14190 [Ralstonia solanacearum]QKM33769.1 hypothetical protein HI794_14185 [Ralstonia solanacearum]QKM38756.1 hypothetical protein HI793_14195 [Ralstonia solanacearum]
MSIITTIRNYRALDKQWEFLRSIDDSDLTPREQLNLSRRQSKVLKLRYKEWHKLYLLGVFSTIGVTLSLMSIGAFYFLK